MSETCKIGKNKQVHLGYNNACSSASIAALLACAFHMASTAISRHALATITGRPRKDRTTQPKCS